MNNFCEDCKVEFVDEYSYKGHLQGKKHLRNAEQANKKRKLEQNSIFVFALPTCVSQAELLEFFNQFGPIENHRFGRKNMIIEYKNRQTADYLLHNPIYMGKWKLKIKKRVVEFPNQKKREPPNKTNRQGTSEDGNDIQTAEAEKVKTELESVSTFEIQYEKFLQLVQDNDNDLEKRCCEVINSINRCFRLSFPNGTAVRFGSTVTGLHLKHSDMDIYFDIGEPMQTDDEPKNDRLRWNQKTVFNQVKSILFKKNAIFSRPVPIPLAKTPVIKFKHIDTNTDCDITFKHNLGVHNSQLIKYLMTLDPRIKPLMIIIKYWARTADLSGTGKITNYTLVMAIIFYLQQPEINLLPAIKLLQSTVEPIYNCGWLVNFDRNYESSSDNNTSCIPELLQGFFKFYADFNFAILLICPLDGLAHKKVDFAKVTKESDSNLASLNLNRPVCIQDPIQLDHNIASGWNERSLQSFQSQCAEALKICETSASDDYKNLLPMLADPNLKQKSLKHKSIETVIPISKFEMFGLPADFETCVNIENKPKFIVNNWFNNVYALVVRIFEKIFKFEVQEMYDDSTMKQQKTEEESDVHTKEHDSIMLYCRGKYCLNRLRKNKNPGLDPTLSCIDRETLISDAVLKDLNTKKQETHIKFIAKLEKLTETKEVRLTLINKQFTNKPFTEVSSYIISKIGGYIDKELQHMVQYKKEL